MAELWPTPRSGPKPVALHCSFEKSGLTLSDQVIPWNADAVVVEAIVRLSPREQRNRTDFKLGVGPREHVADSIHVEESLDQVRLVFRIPVPSQALQAHLLWHNRRIGMLTVPLFSEEEFLSRLRVGMPTVTVRVGECGVGCKTFVSSQCRGLTASGLLISSMNLAPLADFDLFAQLCDAKGDVFAEARVLLTGSQLSGKQALVSAMMPRLPRRSGRWSVRWIVGDHVLLGHLLHSVSPQAFLKSLRLIDTRFLCRSADGGMHLSRKLPVEAHERMGPCFIISSSEPGMAGMAQFRVEALLESGESRTLCEHNVLVSDGPTLVAPGTLVADEFARVQNFNLYVGRRMIGQLSMTPTPEAHFTSEGGFRPVENYVWTPQSEDALQERLTQLLEM